MLHKTHASVHVIPSNLLQDRGPDIFIISIIPSINTVYTQNFISTLSLNLLILKFWAYKSIIVLLKDLLKCVSSDYWISLYLSTLQGFSPHY